MIVDCALVKDGKRLFRPTTVEEAGKLLRHMPGTWTWVGLRDPSGEEWHEVVRTFGLPAERAEQAVDAGRRPIIVDEDGWMFAVIKTIGYLDDTSDVSVGAMSVFISDRVIVTVRLGHGGSMSPALRRLDHDPDLARHGPGTGLLLILDAALDNYRQVTDALALDLEQLESEVFSPASPVDAQEIYNLKREVLEFRRAVVPLVLPLTRLSRSPTPHVPEDLQDGLSDALDELREVVARIESFESLLSAILQAHLADVSVRENEDMRKISAWAAIIAVPTAVAGIYGMNFEHMPELRWRFAYPVVLGLISVVCVLLYRRFRRSGWL